jgi:zinc D-Ala-D-Ala carboxypeptidase
MLIQDKDLKRKIIKNTLVIIALILVTVTGYFNFLLLKQTSLTQDWVNSQYEAILSDNFSELYREAIKRRPVYIELPGAEKIQAIVDDYEDPASIWVLVSKSHPIPEDYAPSDIVIPDVLTRLDKSNNERSVRSDISQAVVELFEAAKNDGFELLIGSGYRPASLQSIYFYSLANSIGEVAANKVIARPGQSEHQTGLAIDISTASYECYLDNCFAYTSGGEWLMKNAYKYGFILRYPEGKEGVTGYMYESWHYRYVGKDLAGAIYQSGLTLDEAWPYMIEALATLKKNRAIEP